MEKYFYFLCGVVVESKLQQTSQGSDVNGTGTRWSCPCPHHEDIWGKKKN